MSVPLPGNSVITSPIDDYTDPRRPGLPGPSQWRKKLYWVGVGLSYLLFILVALDALNQGLLLRRWAWESTTDIRFTLDLQNAIDWGRYANQDRVGVQQLYEMLVKRYGDEGEFRGPAPIDLDYPPLRLMIVANWTDWAQRTWSWRPRQPVTWQPEYEFNRPMIDANIIGEIAGAIGMFLLVRYWIRRCSNKPGPCRGLWSGLIAALLLWFNPAVIWNAHVFPQWDAWLLGPFLLAVYLALTNRWLVAGLLVGVAAMAKGQILLITPILLLWPIVMFHPVAVIRMAVGFIMGVVAVVWPWLINSWPAAWWVLSVLSSLAVLLPLFFLRSDSPKSSVIRGMCIWISAGLLVWPFLATPDFWGILYAGLIWVALILGATFLPRRAIAAWGCAAASSAALLCVPLFNGSMAWYKVGLVYGTRHWKTLAWRHPTNLGAILGDRYRWMWAEEINLADLLPFLNSPYMVPMRYLLIAAFGLSLLMCAVAIALHARRRDRRLLYAIVAPWVLMFALLPQMMPRYLIWAAAFSAAVAVISADGFLLYLLVTLASWANMARDQIGELTSRPLSRWPPGMYDVYKILRPIYPDFGWAVLLLALIWLVLAMIPSPGRRRFLPSRQTTLAA